MQFLLHRVCCTQLFLQTALLRVNSFAHCSAEIYCKRFGAYVLMHTGLMRSVLLRNSTTRLLYSYITTLALHHCTTATLLPLYYTTATCNYTLWLHYDTTATLHLHCELTRTRNTLHYYSSTTLMLHYSTTRRHYNTAALLATLLPHYCRITAPHSLHYTLNTAPRLNLVIDCT